MTTGIRRRARDRRWQHRAPGHARTAATSSSARRRTTCSRARRRSRRSTARTASRGVTTLVSSTPDGTPADSRCRPSSAVMRDDGRIVALGGGFQALWPLTAGRRHVSLGPARSREPTPSRRFRRRRRPAGRAERRCRSPKSPAFSPDGQRVYLVRRVRRGLGLLGLQIRQRLSSTTSPAPASCSALPGFRSARRRRPSSTADPCRSITRRKLLRPSYFLRDFSRYDAVTGRVTKLVPTGGRATPATADRRTLYRGTRHPAHSAR